MAYQIDLSGKYALVTGGAGGIGYGIACALKQAGAEVTVTARTSQSVEQCQTETPAGPITALRMDVTNDLSIEEAFEDIDRLDILVNNAGTIIRQGAEFKPERFADVVNVNLIGAMRVSHFCLGKLAMTRGSIVNIASMMSLFGAGFAPGYSASKTGLIGLTRSLAAAWADQGVRINAIAPGFIRTKMTVPVQEDQTRNAQILARTPMKRWGEPDDIAGAALFLCSPMAAFVTGATIVVDGGYSITG